MSAVTGPRWRGLLIVVLTAITGIVLFSRVVGIDVALLQPLSARIPIASAGTVASLLLSGLLGIGAGLLAAWRSGWINRRLRALLISGCSACLIFVLLAGALWLAVHQELLAVPGDASGRAGLSALCTLLLPSTAVVFAASGFIAVRVGRSARRSALEAHVQTVRAWGLPTTALVIRRVLMDTLPAVLRIVMTEFVVLYAGSSMVQAFFTTPILAESVPLLPAESLPTVLAMALLCIVALVFTGVPLARTLLEPPLSPLRVPTERGSRTGTGSGAAARSDVTVLPSTGFRSADILDIRDLRLHSGITGGTPGAGLDLTVSRGQAVAVVGEDGDGASLLCHAIAGLLPVNAAISSGSILLDGTELVGLPEREFRRLRGGRIGFLAAPGRHRLDPGIRIGQQLAQLASVDQPKAETVTNAVRLLTRLGVADAISTLTAYPHQVSEGTVQRVLLAGALFRDPELLIADDPAGALSSGDGDGLLDVLHEIRRERGFALIVASAGVEQVRRCDRVAVLERGTIVEHASAEELLSDPKHPHSRRLLVGRSVAPPEPHP
jgi:ABC-type dipeptide/oligopeptide/nickel transport system ATPase component